MATDKQSSSSEVTSTQVVVPSNSNGVPEPSVLQITGHKLGEKNYVQWSQSVMMYIYGKGKDDYLTGAISAPPPEDPRYKVWKTENSMVMSWLINSMTNEIGEDFMFYQTAKEIWDAAKESYSDKDNTSELFEIKGILNDLFVTQYFNALNKQWQRLDIYDELKLRCAECNLKYKKFIENERVFKFLLGLDKILDEVRGRILGTKPLPSIREAYSEVRREESRKKVMLGKTTQPSSNESSALAVNNVGASNDSNKSRKGGRPWCNHCKRPGHTRDTC